MHSFIIPAYNEEREIGSCLRAINKAAVALGLSYETIVVDDASTDRTAELALSNGARLIRVEKRHIAAVRNEGAAHARGDVLVFVDADTVVPVAVIARMIEALRHGAVGGGSRVAIGDDVPWGARLSFFLFNLAWRPARLAAGCFLFARRDAFESIGGFDERYYASEEIWMSRALKSRGRFVIVREPVLTSGRKARLHSPLEVFATAAKLLVKGPRSWRRREGLEFWYDGRRESSIGD